MFLGWPIEIIGAILLLFIVIAIYIGVIFSSFKKYENAEKDAGSVIMEIEPSKRTLMMRRAELFAVFLFIVYFGLTKYIQDQVIRTDGWIIIPAVIAAHCLRNKPQKLCEKGILVDYGLFSWDSIEEIMPVGETDDKIKLKLYKQMHRVKMITLYSKPEDIMNIVHMIERKMGSTIAGREMME